METAAFHTTRWTLVSQSRGGTPEAQHALSELCEAYYGPVVAFLRRDGRDDDAARDLAHSFFAKLLERGSPGDAEPGRGRFRNYLLGAVKHFVANQRRDIAREKRGGGAEHLALSETTGTSPGTDIADASASLTDAAFDRDWAVAILGRALTSLESDQNGDGTFAILKPWLTPGGHNLSQADTAKQLGMTEGALKVAIHRLRKSLRELVRREILQTLYDPADLADEMQHLIAALAA